MRYTIFRTAKTYGDLLHSRTSPSQPSHVRVALHKNGIVLLDLRRGKMFSGNHLAGLIWQRLLAGELVAEIAADLSREYGVPLKQVEEDSACFVQQLRQRRLLAFGGRS